MQFDNSVLLLLSSLGLTLLGSVDVYAFAPYHRYGLKSWSNVNIQQQQQQQQRISWKEDGALVRPLSVRLYAGGEGEKEVEEDYRIKYKDCVGKRISHESSWMTGTGVITKITKCSIQFKLDGFDTIKTVRENFKIDMSTEAVDTVDTVPDHNNTLRKKEGREVDV